VKKTPKKRIWDKLGTEKVSSLLEIVSVSDALKSTELIFATSDAARGVDTSDTVIGYCENFGWKNASTTIDPTKTTKRTLQKQSQIVFPIGLLLEIAEEMMEVKTIALTKMIAHIDYSFRVEWIFLRISYGDFADLLLQIGQLLGSPLLSLGKTAPQSLHFHQLVN
jgi:hypothetical protein